MPLFVTIMLADVAATAIVAAVVYARRKVASNPIELKKSSVVIPFPTFGRKAKRSVKK